MAMNIRWRSGLLALAGAASMMATLPMSATSSENAKPQKLSVNASQRAGYAVVPLSTFKGSTASGDPAQLPLIALKSSMGPQKRLPKVELDRSNPTQIVAWVTYSDLEDDSVKGIRYRVEMVPSDSLCTCQSWKIAWVGRQYQCQANRGAQDWSEQLCR
jgi:hypothetical protein